MRLFPVILFAVLLLSPVFIFSQTTPGDWQLLERSIRNKHSLDSICLVLEQKTVVSNDWVEVARAYRNLLRIKDLKTEDSLYFQNSCFIDSILATNGNMLMKGLMHFLLAERLGEFRTKSLRFNRDRYESKTLPINYAAFSDGAIDSLVAFHFEQARQFMTPYSLPAEKIIWLSSSPTVFLFTPTVADIVYQEELNNVAYSKRIQLSRQQHLRWLALSQDAFVDTLKGYPAHDLIDSKAIKIYLQWLAYCGNDKERFYFVETLAHQYVFGHAHYYDDLDIEKSYETYLSSLQTSPYNMVKASGIEQLCLLWAGWSQRYSSPYNWVSSFDKQYQPYAAKALQLYEQHQLLFEPFGVLKNRLMALSLVTTPELSVSIGRESEPAKPMLAMVEYRNVATLYYRIIPVTLQESKLYTWNNIGRFLERTPVRSAVLPLPQPGDHNFHRSAFKVDGLPAGSYCLAFSGDPDFKEAVTAYELFRVTALSLVYTDDKVYVLNRTTGIPVEGAQVTGIYTTSKTVNKKEIETAYTRHFVSGRNGAFSLPTQENYDFTVCYKNDTLFSNELDMKRESRNNDVYDKEEDYLTDYYDDKCKVAIYTDRAIYRPGQTVHFKALFVTRNAATGEPMLMNKANLRKGFINYLKKWKAEEEPFIFLEDPFGNDLDSVAIDPDEYGAVSGSFVIPKNAATGRWKLDPNYLDTYNNDGGFKVEEYKRPTFELTIAPPAKTYRYHDTLPFKMQVRSFAGVNLANVAVKYTIVRQVYPKDNGGWSLQNTTLYDTTGYTNATGELIVPVTDTLREQGVEAGEGTVTYKLEATATDATGEEHEANRSIKVSNAPVVIQAPVAKMVNAAELHPILITTKDLNGLATTARLKVQLYQLPLTPQYDKVIYRATDQWAQPVNDLQAWFPNMQFTAPDTAGAKGELITEAWVNTANADKFHWPMEVMHTGNYRMVVTAVEGAQVIGKTDREFTVFEPGLTVLPNNDQAFFRTNAGVYDCKPGDTITIYTGTAFNNTHVVYHVKYYSNKKGNHGMVSNFFERVMNKGISEQKWVVPQDAVTAVTISQLFIQNNVVYDEHHEISVSGMAAYPRIQVTQFRSKLAPGATATLSVTVTTNNKKTAAQLMTAVYDASLDKLVKKAWLPPDLDNRRGTDELGGKWNNAVKEATKSSVTYPADPSFSSFEKPSWWYYAEADVMADWNNVGPHNPMRALEGRVAGLSISDGDRLQELVVVGYGNAGAAPSVRIHGLNSLQSYKQPLIILDGKPYDGDLSGIDIKEVTDIVVLKDAAASAIYGARAAAGVLIISTKGPIQLPAPEEPVIKVRSNFNETAFFSPAIYADRDGNYTFSFTAPESLTEWNWKLLAHTKDLQFAYEERKLITQLPFMVQPNYPSLVYEGDQLVLKSRISNLDTVAITGKATCKIEDVVTGEDVSALLLKEKNTAFTAGSKSNTTVAFRLQVPEKFIHPIKITVLASAGGLGDGEEQVIPVLSKQVLVKYNQPVVVKQDTVVHPPAFINNAYGVELSLQPNPQAALLQALPYLANYPYNCAEQLSNKLYAYVTALMMMRKDTALRNLYQQQVDKSSTPVTSTLNTANKEAMPWLGLHEKSRKEQDELLAVLDTIQSKEKIETIFDQLTALQKADGSTSWFSGGATNRRISFYVLEKLGQLYEAYNWGPGTHAVSQVYDKQFMEKLVAYTDRELADTNNLLPGEWLAGCYARSCWLRLFPLEPKAATAIRASLSSLLQRDTAWSLRSEALLCATACRYFATTEVAYGKAISKLQSIKQRAIIDNANGMRWKELADGDELAFSGEETLAYLLDAFKTAGDTNVAPAVIKWLSQKSEDGNWRTTTGTSAAIDVLLKDKDTVTINQAAVQATLGDTSLQVTDGLLSGNRVAFSTIKKANALSLVKKSAAPVAANIGWYYFSDSLYGLNKQVQLTKTITRFNKGSQAWEPVNTNTVLQVGDQLTITLTIETPKALRYVFIEDNKAAAFEPPVYESGMVWGGDVAYYAATPDKGKQFFIDFIPSGRTTLTYEMKVQHEGRFTCGAARLECMYRPEITAYSNRQVVQIAER